MLPLYGCWGPKPYSSHSSSKCFTHWTISLAHNYTVLTLYEWTTNLSTNCQILQGEIPTFIINVIPSHNVRHIGNKYFYMKELISIINLIRICHNIGKMVQIPHKMNRSNQTLSSQQKNAWSVSQLTAILWLWWNDLWVFILQCKNFFLVTEGTKPFETTRH